MRRRGLGAGGWALVAGCWLLVAGCAEQRPPAPAIQLGSAPCVVASLLVRVQPKEGDGELVTVRLWSEADGRTLVKGKKLDLDFFAALVQADGSWQAWMPRERVRAQGRLGEGPSPQLLRDLRLLLGELKQGPGAPGEIHLGPDGLPQSRDIPGHAHLDYARWAVFEGLQRPTSVALRVEGDPDRYELRLKSLDAPPEISAERMRLDIPADIPDVGAAELVRRLGG